jgi:kumamolisin
MPRSESFAPLPGSTVRHPGAKLAGPVDGGILHRVTVVLKPRMKAVERAARVERLASQLPHERQYLNQAEFEELCGANPGDLEVVERFARKHGLTVESSSRTRRCVRVKGTLAKLSRAFRVALKLYEEHGSKYVSHTGAIYVTSELVAIVESVLGLDHRPVRHADVIAIPPAGLKAMAPAEVAEAYSFPPGVDGSGQKVGIVLPGSGFQLAAVKHHFKTHTNLPMPRIRLVRVLDAKNKPASQAAVKLVVAVLSGRRTMTGAAVEQFSNGMNTIESNMDVILVGSFAPGALIVIYVSPDTHEGNYHALTHATTDPGHPGVVSCSWSSLEGEYSPAVRRTMNTVFELAALKGVTLCFSSGDDGDGTLWGLSKKPAVHFPASSPWVLACGGTSLKRKGHGFSEVAWSEPAGKLRMASGGGYSAHFRQPPWQKGMCTEDRRRGVPDVSAKADVADGYEMDASGISLTMGGTSAAVPLWAALAALLNRSLGVNVGILGPLLYSERFRGLLRDIVSGDNGAWKAGPGWDPVTGWGSPHGIELLRALRGEPEKGGG